MTNEQIKALKDVTKAAAYARVLGLTDRQITDATMEPLPNPEPSGGQDALSNANSVDPKPRARSSAEDLLGEDPSKPKK